MNIARPLIRKNTREEREYPHMNRVLESLALPTLLVLAALSLSLSGCASDSGGANSQDQTESIDSFCDAAEDCGGKPAGQCRAEIEDQSRDAENLGCEETFADLVDCFADAECDGEVLIADCESETKSHGKCVNEADPNEPPQ